MIQTARKLGFLLVSALAAAACMSSYGDWKEVDATPARLSNLPEYSSVTLTLRDGRSLFFGGVLDYGDALCDEDACVRKRDVARVKYQEKGVDLLASALIAPIAGAVMLVCVVDCADSKTVRHVSGPRATSLQIRRKWLDSLSIVDGMLIDPSLMIGGKIENACVPPSPSAPAQTFATDAEAFAWITANRQRVMLGCIESAFRGMDAHDEKRYVEALMQLTALRDIREKWNDSRCVSGPDQPYISLDSARAITPRNWFRIDGRRGDARALAILDQTLADRTVYDFDGDLETHCKYGVLPSEDWPEIDAWIEAHSPYISPKPAGTN